MAWPLARGSLNAGHAKCKTGVSNEAPQEVPLTWLVHYTSHDHWSAEHPGKGAILGPHSWSQASARQRAPVEARREALPSHRRSNHGDRRGHPTAGPHSVAGKSRPLALAGVLAGEEVLGASPMKPVVSTSQMRFVPALEG